MFFFIKPSSLDYRRQCSHMFFNLSMILNFMSLAFRFLIGHNMSLKYVILGLWWQFIYFFFLLFYDVTDVNQEVDWIVLYDEVSLCLKDIEN